MDWLSREIRSAGFYGCISRGPPPTIVADDFTGFPMGLQAVVGYENGTGWTNPTTITRVAGDVLEISGMYGTAANVLDDNPKAVNANVKVDKCIGLKQNDLVMVANCSRSTIMRVTNNPESGACPVPPGQFNTVSDANNVNDPNFRLNPPYLVTSRAILFRFGAYAYFIGRNPANRPSLYRTSTDAGSPLTEEVVENIENMDLLFGEDADGDGFADSYITASNVANWQRVVSVRVTLVAVSPDAGATQQRQNYYFGAISGSGSGTALNWQTATDSRLRQVFVSTIAIRNKLP
jgi:type IV pilus assembly protein PilW